RNRLRASVWPALTGSFANAEVSLVAAAHRAQEAAACLAELAGIDIAACIEGGGLRCAAWRLLSAPRQANLLRAWLPSVVAGAVPETLLQRLPTEMATARSGRWPAPGGELRLHDGVLHFARLGAAVATPGAPAVLDLALPGEHGVPGWRGHFAVDVVAEGGIPAALLQQAQLRPRQGGEQFQRAPRSLARSLKKQYQALRVPAWQRDGPLVYSGDGQLLYVPGLGVDARCMAPAGASQRRLQWLADNGEGL
ncbi:MAG: tRNA lysidine(34) synthetase TilS, partial [Alphaproteobacteria bacterium]|nr:tRNA lysidine(34) synthetase TilS [Alphaproteobacteria bacterium]